MKTMPNSTQEEKYRWIKPILEDEITIKDMTKSVIANQFGNEMTFFYDRKKMSF